MTLTIDLPNEQVAALKAKVAALTLETWLGKLAQEGAREPLKAQEIRLQIVG